MLGLLATTFLFLTEELLHCINMIIISQQDRSANCRYSYWCMIRHVCILFIKTKLATCLWSCWQTQLKPKFFFLSGFSFTDTDDSQDSRGREGTIFDSTLPLKTAHKHSDIYFATLHVRWLSHISNRTAYIYQAATRWDLPPYWSTVWLIDDVMLIFVCLLVDLVQGFCYIFLTLETGGLELASTIILYYKRTN